MRPRRPLRSVFLGNPHYLSVYALGVAQAMGILGHWHRSVSIFDSPSEVAKQIAEMQPDLIWTHMTLWPPHGSSISVDKIAEILTHWKHRGAAVYLHDGDPRERKTHVDVSRPFSIALINRSIESDPWGIPSLRWPYAAMVQREIAPAHSAWTCDLYFAGLLRSDGLYGERTALVNTLRDRLGERMRVSPGTSGLNSRMLVADIAPSAGAVLGFGRPEVRGWIDTRVFQYPGAGGILIHDDAGEFLEPGRHYLRFDRASAVDSVLRCLEQARHEGEMRERAFQHVQTHHTWVQRVEQALAAFYGKGV